jgi:hypothetical protein
MKKQLLHIATTLSLCLMLGIAATAQITRQMTVTIPFAFYVGKTALPAGTYTLYATGTHTGESFLLRTADGQTNVAFNTQQVQSGESQLSGRLEFRQHNGKHFLARVWSAGNNIGHELQLSQLERETAQRDARPAAPKGGKLEVITGTTR